MQEYDKLLEMRGISKSFSGVKALNDVHFDLFSGEIHALVGENGAGKSTLVKILTGVENKDSGQIKLNSEKVNIKSPHHARKLGIAVIFQELSQIPTLTVAENVFLCQEAVKSGIFLDRKTMVSRTEEILHRYEINLEPTAKLSSLSTAQCQLAEIVKAISLNPKILIMDEPTSSLSERETKIVFKIIEDCKNTGIGIVYVSHRMDEIFSLADRVTVLRDGNFIDDCAIEELDLPKIVKLMVGREVELYESNVKGEEKKAECRYKLEVKNLTRKKAFSNVSFALYEGEILGIAGLVGSGRSELVETIFGVEEIDSGQILLDGSPVKISSVRDALDNGIALLPESRHIQGLVLKHSIEQNMILPVLKKFSCKGIINYKKARQFVKDKIEDLNIKADNPKQIVSFLSGGNQQKVVISKWLTTDPRILIVDEPTAGVDVHSKSEIHRLIRKLAQKGISIIMISSEMPELLVHSDRIMVMNQGRILGIFEDIDQEAIMSLIMEDIMKSKTAIKELC